MRGKYICLDGPDGVGKSTLVRAVHAKLLQREGRPPAQLLTFPSREGAIGKLIREVLSGTKKVDIQAMMYLFFADAIDHEVYIFTMLDAGADVIVDRHALYSGRAYQLEQHSSESIRLLHDSHHLNTPDHIFFLYAPIEVLKERMAGRGKRKDVVYEGQGDEHLLRICGSYDTIAEDLIRERGPREVHELNATRPLEDLVNEVLAQACLA